MDKTDLIAMKKLFQSLDTESTGVISFASMNAALFNSSNTMTDAIAKQICDGLDYDGDGW